MKHPDPDPRTHPHREFWKPFTLIPDSRHVAKGRNPIEIWEDGGYFTPGVDGDYPSVELAAGYDGMKGMSVAAVITNTPSEFSFVTAPSGYFFIIRKTTAADRAAVRGIVTIDDNSDDEVERQS